MIRVADYFASPIADWREAGMEAECTAGWEAWAGVIREVADEYGVAMALRYDAFNGPDHDTGSSGRDESGGSMVMSAPKSWSSNDHSSLLLNGSSGSAYFR